MSCGACIVYTRCDSFGWVGPVLDRGFVIYLYSSIF